MKKLTLMTVFAATAITATAAIPFLKGEGSLPPHRGDGKEILTPGSLAPFKAKNVITKAAEPSTLFEEDFSGFPEGAEDMPAPVIEFEDVYHIPASRTKQPGWTGQGVRPTGGSVALFPWETDYGDTRGGYISTPPAMMEGTATITLRAKRYGNEEAILWVSLCDDYYGPGDDDEFTLTEEWQEFTLQAQGSLEDPSYFQIMAEEGVAIVDDVKVTFRRDRIASPYANKAVNVSPTEFIASWEDTGAPEYRLTVLELAKPENYVEGELVENFDGINASADGIHIDAANPGYPEGWTISLSGEEGAELSREEGWYKSAPQAIVINDLKDVAESPEVPEPLTSLSFWVRPTKYEDDQTYMSLLKIEIYHSRSGNWETIAQIPYYYLTPEGLDYTMSEYALGNDATRVRFSMIQKGNVDFVIDDVKMAYKSRGILSTYIDAQPTSECSVNVSGINPDNEYTYFVQAVDDDLISAASNEVWVDGLEGLKVAALPAEDITEDGFTAKWNALGHAEKYSVALNRTILAMEDMEDVTVLEEDFNGITEGTFENPGTYWLSPYNFGEQGWTATEWQSTNPAWVNGMAGSNGTTWYGTAGLVFSPRLDLSCNEGKGFDVEATVYTTTDGFDDGQGNEYAEGVFVMVLDSYTDSQAKAYALIETPVTGSTTAKVHVPVAEDVDLKDVIVAFMSMSGQPFFVDNVKITQNMLKGEKMTAPLLSKSTSDLELSFSGLDKGTYGYTVKASVEHDYENYISLPSDLVEVSVGESGVASIAAGAAAEAEVYSLEGLYMGRFGELRAVKDALPSGVYIIRHGEETLKIMIP